MKFLDIDTKVVGNKLDIFKCLQQLKELENNFKLYINPEYLQKFCFVVSVGQNVYCEIKRTHTKLNESQNPDSFDTDIYFSLYNFNEGHTKNMIKLL